MMPISAYFENPLNFFWWLSIPLSWWMRTQLLAKPQEAKHIRTDQPVLYVLPFRSFSDLLVLYYYCKKLGLPLPTWSSRKIKRGGQASYVYLSKLGLLQAKRTRETPTVLQRLCLRMERDVELNVQIVPVSIIWGRNPGSEELSLFKLLFPDDEHAGILQKIFIILAQGRNTLVHFGEPISLREQVDIGPDAEQVARKLRRVLRVHFRTQRTTTVGPKAYDRARVMRYIFDSPIVQNAIEAEVRKSGADRSKTEEKVRHYLREISSAQNHSIVRFFDILLTYVWNKIYGGIEVRNDQSLRSIADTHEIVYYISHRSHLDYLVLPYVLYYRGLAVPHTVAGVNLSFWPLGPILRRGGAFFIRRSFRGNRLYSLVFTEYLSYLMVKGHPIAFFPEGGRSRTGRLLQPKTGMLAMVVQSYLRNPTRPLAFIPVYVGYDKVAEVKSYLGELRGAAKKKESFRELLKVWRVLTMKHGSAYVGFSDPVFMNDLLDSAMPSWRTLAADDLEGKPRWLSKMISDSAVDMMRCINDSALVGPVSLVSIALLSNPQRAVPLEELEYTIDALRRLLADTTGPKPVTMPTMSARELVKEAEEVSPVNRFVYGEGSDVIYLNEIDASLLVYYRNNVIHYFAYPSLLASFLMQTTELLVEDAAKLAVAFHSLLSADLFLKLDVSQGRAKMQQCIESFVHLKLLHKEGDKLLRCDITSPEYGFISTLAKLLAPLYDRYFIGFAMLNAVGIGKPVEREKFEKDLADLSQKIALLKGIADPEVADKPGIKLFVDILRTQGLIKDREAGVFAAQPSIAEAARFSESILGPDILRSIRRQYSQG